MRVDELRELHPMADLLASCPGMTKEHVYYLEQRGYVTPIKQRHGKIERNLFTRDQVRLVRAVWVHRQAGLPPREAYRRALRETSGGQLSIWPNEDLGP